MKMKILGLSQVDRQRAYESCSFIKDKDLKLSEEIKKMSENLFGELMKEKVEDFRKNAHEVKNWVYEQGEVD